MNGYIISFCKRCEMYHVDWDKNKNLNKIYETHLSPVEFFDVQAFNVFHKDVEGLSKGYLQQVFYSVYEATKQRFQMKAFKEI